MFVQCFCLYMGGVGRVLSRVGTSDSEFGDRFM